VRNLRIVPPADFPTIPFESQDAWEGWLREHHASADGVWIKVAKKASGIPTVVWAEAVEVALCYGWIDGQAKRVDDSWYVQKFTPRRKRSIWSRVNVDKANALIEAGRMQPAGLREIERAKADGRWDAAYEPPSSNHVPEELQRALDGDPAVAAAFEQLDSQNRYAMQHRVATAKKPETRVRRAEKFAAMLRAGEKLYP
jgi:uncharacterized protein YdeI (YjbR/CyaY-like superfamily)